jgi:hypothetical protein
MAGLRLLAADAGDLAPLAALVQDALLRPVDIGYEPRARRLVLMLSRYRWEAASPSRVRSALRIETVSAVQRRGWPGAAAGEGETMLNLLTIDWAEPWLTLVFSGGVTLRAQCEVVDLVLEDVSEAWESGRRPTHQD